MIRGKDNRFKTHIALQNVCQNNRASKMRGWMVKKLPINWFFVCMSDEMFFKIPYQRKQLPAYFLFILVNLGSVAMDYDCFVHIYRWINQSQCQLVPSSLAPSSSSSSSSSKSSSPSSPSSKSSSPSSSSSSSSSTKTTFSSSSSPSSVSFPAPK